jgi:hypothetical protein
MSNLYNGKKMRQYPEFIRCLHKKGDSQKTSNKKGKKAKIATKRG